MTTKPSSFAKAAKAHPETAISSSSSHQQKEERRPEMEAEAEASTTATSTASRTSATMATKAAPPPADQYSLTFPIRLHQMLTEIDQEEGGGGGGGGGLLGDVVSWQPHGRAFRVHHRDRFVSEVLPRYFRQGKYSSFQRQLNSKS